jgi:hypothetical protein
MLLGAGIKHKIFNHFHVNYSIIVPGRGGKVVSMKGMSTPGWKHFV